MEHKSDSESSSIGANAESVPAQSVKTDATKSGGRRSRNAVKLACHVCRQKRIRCDGQRPACESCIRAGVSCEYVLARRKAGPPKGHLRSLHERLGK